MAWHLEGRFHGFSANSPAGDGLRVVPGANRRASPHDGDAQRIWWRQRDRIRESYDGNAYRAVYTLRYADAVYVLHAFQKKSKKGKETPKRDIDLITKRLKDLVQEKENGK